MQHIRPALVAMRLAMLVLVILVMGICSSPRQSSARASDDDGSAPSPVFGGMRIVGHRGSSADNPENTVQAARVALEKGAIGTEFDVHLSRDRRIFVLHDTTLNRTASRKPTEGFSPPSEKLRHTPVSDLNYKGQLDHVDVGSYASGRPEKVPLMEEIMDLVVSFSEPSRPKFAFCELKRGEADAMVDEMEKLVRGNGDILRYKPENLIFISFDIRVLYKLKQKLPDFKFLFIAQGDPSSSTPYTAEEAIAMARFPRQASAAYDAAVAQYRASHRGSKFDRRDEMLFAKTRAAEAAVAEVVRGAPSTEGLEGIDLMARTDYATSEIVNKATAHGLEVAVWVWADRVDTVNGAIDFSKFGVDYFTSNLPADFTVEIRKSDRLPIGWLAEPTRMWPVLIVSLPIAVAVGYCMGRRRKARVHQCVRNDGLQMFGS